MPAVQYPNLSEMFYEGPGISKYYEGSRRADEATANNAQNLAEAQAQAYREQQLHPLAVQEKQQLIRQRQLGNNLAEAGQPSALKKIQYGAEEADYKAQQQFGQALEQWGSIAEANGGQIPLQLQQRMPPELAQLFAQPNGWQQAKQAGSAMREASMKWLQQQSKQGSAEGIAESKDAVRLQAIQAATDRAREDRLLRERLAGQRLDNARKLAADKRAGSNDKKSLEQYAVELERAASDLEFDDPRAAQILKQRAAAAFEKAKTLKAAAGQGRTDLQRDLYQEVGVLPPPTQKPTVQAAPAAAAPADPYAGFKIK